MYRLEKNRNKKGYILVEAVLALAIISLTLGSAFFAKSYVVKQNKRNSDNVKYINYIEALKNELYFNVDYDVLEREAQGTNYITKENINMEVLKTNEVNKLLRRSETKELPYVIITVVKKESILEIDISMHTKYKNLNTTVYKGD